MDSKNSKMTFHRIGGSWQLPVRNAADIAAAIELDPAHWAVNSIGRDTMIADKDFLAFIDADGNGRIKSDEVCAAARWLLTHLADDRGLREGSETLALAAIRGGSEEGDGMLAAAKWVLALLGRDGELTLSLADIRKADKTVADGRCNGDGIVVPALIEEPELSTQGALVTKLFGGKPDASGEAGFDLEALEKFEQAARRFLDWRALPPIPELTVLGEELVPAAALFAELLEKLAEFFAACEMLAFAPGSAARLDKAELAADVLDAASVAHFLETAPLAQPASAGVLTLDGALNPVWRERVLRLGELLRPLLRCGTEISLTDFRRLAVLFGRYETQQAAKPTTEFDAVAATELERFFAVDAGARLRELIREDLAAGEAIKYCGSLYKFALYQRYMVAFLNNFVNLSELFQPQPDSMLQAGTLVMDGRHFTLVTMVGALAEHKKIAVRSDICVVYFEAVSGLPGALRKMTLAAAVTSGNMRNLFIGKSGIFLTADGTVWDARVIDFIQQPVSVSEAMGLPFYRFGEFIGKQADRFFTARSNTVQQAIEKDVAKNAANTAGLMPGAPEPAQTPAVSGSMLLMGGGIGIAAIGSSIAFIAQSLQKISIGQVLAVLLGVILIFGGPVVITSLIKLFRRDVARFLEANSCAINCRMRLTGRMGRLFTYAPARPARSAFNAGELIGRINPLAEKQPRTGRLAVLVILLLLAAAAVYLYIHW